MENFQGEEENPQMDKQRLGKSRSLAEEHQGKSLLAKSVIDDQYHVSISLKVNEILCAMRVKSLRRGVSI